MRSHTPALRLPLLLAATAVLALAAAAYSGGLGRYQTQVVTTLLIYLALAQAWNILAGFGGEISLGVGAFAGTGAYAVGLLMVHTGVGWLPALPVAAGAATALALVLAFPLLRLRGDYFAIGTLAAALALQAWLLNWDFAGGSAGLSLPIERTPTAGTLYQAAVAVAAAAMAAAIAVKHSRFGLRLMAVRDNHAAAEGLGVSVFWHRFAALLISSALTGAAGGLVALQQSSFEPVGMLGIGWTINALLMVVVGGSATLLGPVLGTVIVYYVLTTQFEAYPTVGLIIEGVLLIAIVRFAPQGVWPLATRLVRAAARRARRGSPPAQREAPATPAPSRHPTAVVPTADQNTNIAG